MKKFKLIILLLFIPVFSFTLFNSCSEDDNVDEYAVLLDYLENEGGDFINTYAPAIKPADQVKTDMTSETQYIIDIRSSADFAAGHIEGAVNVAMGDLLTQVEGLTTNYESIVIVCYSGQSAAYGACLLRLMGYDNVYSMKFGMSSWNADFDSWSAKTLNTYATEFEKTDNPIGAKVDPPKVDTGKDKAADILKTRVKELLTKGFGGGEASISADNVFLNVDNYYVVNYWPQDQYLDPGHIPGAYCYVPKTDLKSSTYLNTLPANKTIVVYCYTGQTSAYVTAYLKVLGYDAKSLLYGANNMIYNLMPSGKFTKAAIMNYDYVTGI